ncbi:MAG: CPBP family intramembrane metalloprotease [Candidatus Lokiarchaeota archaeon]|nr:CPBP family intramembrane metalloprotease [Candidatus Lokiarchaeota archaeon]
MAINLGANPFILILFIILEILLIIIPNLIASLVEKKSFKEELVEMGFSFLNYNIKRGLLLISQGILIGVFFYFIGGWIFIFFVDVVIKNVMGVVFVENAINSAISVEPMNPQLIELVIIIVLQVLIVGPCEEGFFRGFILKKIKHKSNYIFALIISSLCFTIYHVPPILVPISTIITFFGYYFTFGLLFGGLYRINKESLLPNMVAHSLFNILILIF